MCRSTLLELDVQPHAGAHLYSRFTRIKMHISIQDEIIIITYAPHKNHINLYRRYIHIRTYMLLLRLFASAYIFESSFFITKQHINVKQHY